MLGMSEEGRGMNQIVLLLPLLLVIAPTGAYATNEGSYKEGYSATLPRAVICQHNLIE